ncbi:helix-turn-helix transcriptional regulator [Oceanobacter sp. 3_MG-2023]|uniref:helix-turn-helix domain-containing protein n=1 Tax=Oceanobacter sp. 3_MG-2023 TaxID=3062622 RepID=UPI002736230D|nr:helix-turn-helix transcriptional regulator [Oceanobacter sp. 3_MG-2023]MDP2505631.1 helix-turn-helix transcriptional regulator [Oceanobacter sp. 3_MG-2023]
MEQTVSERAGSRLKNLRIALGYSKRPEFAPLLGISANQLSNLENLNGRLNEDHFKVISERWPWALGYIASGGDLIIPEGVGAPAANVGKAVSNLAGTSHAAPASMDPAELMKAMTTDPEMKAAFQKMMVEILQAGLGNDSK